MRDLPPKLVRMALLLTAASTSATCLSPDNSLEGTITRDFSLEFDEVRLFKQGCLLRIEYLLETNLGPVVPCSLSVDTVTTALAPDLVIQGETFTAGVILERRMPAATSFPSTRSGRLEFTRFSFVAGAKGRGSFTITFETGQDLRGSFSGVLEEPDPSVVCDVPAG